MGDTDRERGQNAPDVETARLLLSAARQLGETLDPERVYDTFHGLLAKAVPHDGVVISSYDEPATKLIRCEYAWTDGNRLDVSTLPAAQAESDGRRHAEPRDRWAASRSS